jgi:clathrin heavy chain
MSFKIRIIISLRYSYYKAVSFYLQEQPTLLNDLLTVLIPRIDHSRVVRTFKQIDHIPLIRPYLIAVQHVRLDDMNPPVKHSYPYSYF